MGYSFGHALGSDEPPTTTAAWRFVPSGESTFPSTGPVVALERPISLRLVLLDTAAQVFYLTYEEAGIVWAP